MFSEYFFSRESHLYNKFLNKLPEESRLYPDHYKFMHLIYLNDLNNILHFHGSSKEISTDEISYDQLYNHIQPNSFSDCLLLQSLLGHVSNTEIISIFEGASCNSHFLHEITHDANGMLLYQHHLEIILTIFTKMTKAEVIQFRKDWNKKNSAAISLSKDIMINQNESLFDFITLYNPLKPYPFFLSAAFKEAYRLYTSIKIN